MSKRKPKKLYIPIKWGRHTTHLDITEADLPNAVCMFNIEDEGGGFCVQLKRKHVKELISALQEFQK